MKRTDFSVTKNGAVSYIDLENTVMVQMNELKVPCKEAIVSSVMVSMKDNSVVIVTSVGFVDSLRRNHPVLSKTTADVPDHIHLTGQAVEEANKQIEAAVPYKVFTDE